MNHKREDLQSEYPFAPKIEREAARKVNLLTAFLLNIPLYFISDSGTLGAIPLLLCVWRFADAGKSTPEAILSIITA